MKNKNCKTKGCEGMVDSGKSKSGLCTKCSTKEWRKKNKKRLKKYHSDYHEEHKEKYREGVNKRNKVFYKDNKERLLEWHSEDYDKNKIKYKGKSKKYYEENKEKRLEQTRINQNRRYREDEGFRIRKRLGGALGMVIRVYIKTGKIRNPLKKYGVDWEGIIKVLSPIPKDRHKYHVDHIIELRKFDLTNIEQIQIAFSPENHRWLLAKDNLRRDRKE